jgi:hypothetical protein
MTGGRASTRLTIHDVTFAGVFAGSLYGPFDAPPIDAVRAAVRELAARFPHHPVFCRPRIGRFGRGRWMPVSPAERERRCAEMVVELDDADLDGALSQAARPLEEGRLIEYSLGARHVMTRRSHLLGDGTVASLLPHLLRSAITASPLPDLDARSVSLPLTRALVNQFGRRPGYLVDTLREPRPRPPHAPSPVAAEGPRRYDAFGRTATGETMAALRAWRDVHHPGVSVGNVLAAAVRSAFDRAGVEFASPGLRMLVNGRRYLPPGTPLEGNFAAAIYVEPSDPRSPSSVDEVIRRNLDIGRPLATLAASSVKNALTPARGVATASSLGTLTISNLGPRRELDGLPTHPFCEYRGVAQPEPGGLTVLLAQVGECLSASATFDPALVDRGDVAQAIGQLTSDPVALLELPRATSQVTT